MMPYTCHGWQARGEDAQRRPSTAEGWNPPARKTPPAGLLPQRQWLLGGALAVILVGVAGRMAYWQVG